MKKILFCLILLLFPFYVSAKEYSVKDLKLKMDFDDNWYVFTKDNLDDNEDIEKLGLSKEYVKSSFKNGIFLDALLKDKSLEFVGLDSFSRPTYLYNNKIYLKQINFKQVEPNVPIILHDTADNTFDGEPNNPHSVIFVEII